MDKKDKNEMVVLITDALNDVVIPAMDDMETRLRKDLASKEDIKEIQRDLDTIERKLDAQVDRMDRDEKEIETLKSRFMRA